MNFSAFSLNDRYCKQLQISLKNEKKYSMNININIKFNLYKVIIKHNI